MQAYVLLLRGINVGGSGKLPMADLRNMLSTLGAADVATYIQSGNAVFRSGNDPETLAKAVADAIETGFGFRPSTLVLPGADLQKARDAFPFKAALDAPKTGHIWFLSAKPSPDLEALQALKTPDEEFALTGTTFNLYAPSGIGRSKLAAKVEKLLGVAATARNLNSVAKLCDMIAALD